MKKKDLVTSLILVPVDFVMLVAAGLTSYALRYQGFVTRYRPVFFDYPLNEFGPVLLAISVVGVIIFAMGGSYRITSRRKLGETLGKVFIGVSTTVLLVIVTIFLQRELFSSRFVIVFAWILAIVFVFIGRLLVFWSAKYYVRGRGMTQLAIIGDGKPGSDIAQFIKNNPSLGYSIAEECPAFTNEVRERIINYAHQNKLDEVIYTDENATRNDLAQLVNFCHEHHIAFRYVASFYQTNVSNIEMESVAGYPIVQIHTTPLQGWGRILKRSADIMVSVIGLLVLIPVFIIIAICIKSDTTGPVFVRLQRIGRGGKPFILYKFRSMVPNAHILKQEMLAQNERNDGPLFKIKNDPRVTRVGWYLRKTSVDELPQLWNVLRGDMSLVGPRPHEPEEVDRYKPEYRRLLGARPGITGMAQVSGRSNLLFAEEAALDMYYMQNWSLRLDLQIILKTVLVIFKFKEAA